MPMSKVPITPVPMSEARRFIFECLKAVGVNAKPAEQHADLLIGADRIGTYSHGLRRLVYYIDDIERDVCCPNNEPELIKETISTALVDAKNCLGATSSHYAMDIAIQKAKCSGAGWVAVKGANHNGISGYWAMKAAKANLIGLALTNASPVMAPTRSKEAALGCNCLSVVAPGSDGEMFYFDMAMTATSMETIDMRRRDNVPLEIDFALGPDGEPTTDANLAYEAKLLMPLGGGERNSGYKGYGLAGAVEVLCGILAGANYSYKIRQWSDHKSDKPANLGQSFAALDFKTFAPGFQERLTDCMTHWRGLEPADPAKPVLAPGDKEWEYAKKADETGCLEYYDSLLDSCKNIADRLKVTAIRSREIRNGGTTSLG